MSTRRVVVLSRSAREADSPAWGLGQDSKILEQVLREFNAGGHISIDSIDHIDPISFYGSPRKPQPVDIQIHLEVPCFAAWRWAKVNIVVVNPEWWPASAWDWALKERGGADIIVFKSAHARALFPEVDGRRVRVVAWRAGPDIQTALSVLEPATLIRDRKFLFLVGASVNKLAAAKIICAAWKASWPPLKIIGSNKVIEDLRFPNAADVGIEFKTAVPTDKARIKEQVEHGYHIVASVAEGFGYTFAECAAVGALPLWTALPVYEGQWGGLLGDIGKISVSRGDATSLFREAPITFTVDNVVLAVEGLLRLSPDDEGRIRGALRHLATTRVKEFRHDWRSLITAMANRAHRTAPSVLPPKPLVIGELPHVAIITLTRNRPRWFANMARNILLCDYPTDKLTWIVADDGDSTGGRVDEAIIKFQSNNPRIQVKYLSIVKPMAIGAKRNKACDAAPPETSIFIMMDDDDHYPAGSVAGRVAWLRATGVECVYCSTLPMYDCTRYISAVNVPPLDLSPAERVSEATLAFTRKFYEERKFPAAVNIAEGEGFIVGRIEQVVEIPPEGIIVSFIHGKNSSSRRISAEPNGCHYGFSDEFFTYISELGAVA